ncbi:unnamed protein product, partial [Musa acuminata var. zebrina]
VLQAHRALLAGHRTAVRRPAEALQFRRRQPLPALLPLPVLQYRRPQNAHVHHEHHADPEAHQKHCNEQKQQRHHLHPLSLSLSLSLSLKDTHTQRRDSKRVEIGKRRRKQVSLLFAGAVVRLTGTEEAGEIARPGSTDGWLRDGTSSEEEEEKVEEREV